MGYTDLTANFTYKKLLSWLELDALGENDAYLNTHTWETATKAIFFQAAAPTGWTKITTAANNGRILRVVSGSGGGGSAGTQGIGTAITLAHVHSIANQAAHSHGYPHAHAHDDESIGSLTDDSRFWKALAGKMTAVFAGASGTGNMALYSSLTDPGTSSSGAHDHGAATNSSLSDITLAYIDVLICSKDASSGYSDETSVFSYGLNLDNVFTEFAKMAASDEYLRLRLTPATSVMPFYLATAPVGWTKLVSQDNAGLRVITGTGGGTGGSAGFGTALTLAHANTVNVGGTNSHTIGNHVHALARDTQSGQMAASGTKKLAIDASNRLHSRDGSAVNAQVLDGSTNSQGAQTTGTDPDHAHTLTSALTDAALAYVNVIQCSKDSAGSGSVYTDLTAFFADSNLLAWQDLDELAENDAYIKYHTMPAAAATFFFQAAAPAQWTKVATQNDKGLRVVSGGSGGSAGGTLAISTGITLAHTHPIQNYSHSHTATHHSHTVTTAADASAGNEEASSYAVEDSGNSFVIIRSVAGGSTRFVLKKDLSTADPTNPDTTTAAFSHNHGGTTGSALANVTLSYLDVILCTKD